MLNLFLAVAFSASAAVSTATVKAPADDEAKMIYTLGYLLGRNLAPFSLQPADLAKVNAGLRDAALQNKPRHDLNVYAPRIEEWAQQRAAKKSEGEKAKSKGFLEKMAKEKGAEVSPTGLIYIPLREGTGPQPSSTDSIKAHYEGKLLDGTKFDSSYDRGQPTDFGLAAGIIKCWSEGIPKIKVGGKARLICPSEIGYGDEGRGKIIKPGATLDFIVELVGINK
jgi:FKBP-type peptidyl-prolyl cis-trans isomerase